MSNDPDLQTGHNPENRAVSVRLHLKKMVSSGLFAPREKLNAKHIAEAIGVSVTPVREALITLVAEGVIDKLPGQGYFAKSIQYETQCEYYEFFLAMSEFSVRTCFDNFGFIALADPVTIDLNLNEDDTSSQQTRLDSYNLYLNALFRDIAAATKNGKIIYEMNSFIENTRVVREIDLANMMRLREISDDMTELVQFFNSRKTDRAIKNLHSQVQKKIKVMPILTREANSRCLLMPSRNGCVA